jgi:hypothetical protein
VRRFSEDYQMTPKQEEALRDYLQEAIVPLIEEVLVKKLGQAMTFAKKALAEQPAQQEPVGEVNRYGLDSHGRKWHSIYWYDPNVDVPHGTKLYTSSPAQRTWVSLTEDEISLIVAECSLVSPSDHYFAEAIEAKLKEKNT